MQEIISNLQNGTIQISDQFDVNSGTYSIDSTPYFNMIGSEYIISFTNLQNVIQFTKFNYDTLGLTDARLLKNYYRLSRDNVSWTEWMDLKKNIDNFPPVDSKDPLYMDIKWVRSGTSTIGTIRLLEYSLEGILERDEITSTVYLLSGSNSILSAPYIYKVFKLTDIEIITGSDISDVDIKYRYSQDNSRTWSNWETFTKENITTLRINPVRFFQIEYSITNNSSSAISIQDINLIGIFQNVSQDYFKSNLIGIRECCQSNLNGTFDANGNFIPADNNGSSLSNGGTCESSTFSKLTTQEKANLYNPYQQTAAVDLLNKLSTDAELIFGHPVIYFVTDPDKRGQDHTLHEYQLYNVVCEGDLKIAVDNNNFPDNQIVMNQFDLSLFENMTVNITKQQFKEIFGPQRRPSKEDFIYFCNINRMFQVDHAQQFRNFNNAAIYYRVILKKYNQKANIQPGTSEIADKMKMLNQNTTIDELFGVENTQDKKATANKDQLRTLSSDPIRLEYLAQIDRELIENSSTIISKSNYDLSSVTYLTEGVKYKNLNPILKVSDNVGFQIWFNINNYIPNEIYNFMTYYDNVNSVGWKANLSNDIITVKLNSTDYEFRIGTGTSALEEEVWYCYVLNIDQRNRKMEQYIYKRNVDYEDDAANLGSTILRKVYSNIMDIVPIEFEMEGQNCTILGSDMKVTNIRMFVEIIPENVHNKVLNEYIIRDDSKYLVFADNALNRIILPRFPLFE